MQPPSCAENLPAFANHDVLSSGSSSRRTSASVSASALNQTQIFWDNRIHMYLHPDDYCTSAPPRLYSCNYCQRKFYSSQALGGHQNAHKRERTSWASRRVPPATLPPSSSSKVLMRPLLPHANLASVLGVNAGSFVSKQNHSHRSSYFSTASPDMERSSSCSTSSSSLSKSSSSAAFHLGIYRRLVEAENVLIWLGTPKAKAEAYAAAVNVADHPKRLRDHSDAPFMDSSLHSADDEALKTDADTSVDLSLRL